MQKKIRNCFDDGKKRRIKPSSRRLQISYTSIIIHHLKKKYKFFFTFFAFFFAHFATNTKRAIDCS